MKKLTRIELAILLTTIATAVVVVAITFALFKANIVLSEDGVKLLWNIKIPKW